MITICEVGPRDGLQNLSRQFSVAEKHHMVTELAKAGLRQIEAVSMVNPARVPQMAGAEALLAGLPDLADVTLSALILNKKGAERGLATRVRDYRFAVVASDSFCRRNQNMTSEESVAAFCESAGIVRKAGHSITGVIATAYGCPFEGSVDQAHVAGMTRSLIAAGADSIVFADTIGVAAPRDIQSLYAQCRSSLGDTPWGVHLHNTRNTGYANVIAALVLGATIIDASVGGLGGCPFAPRATGNIATEDLHYLLERQGIATGLDHDRLASLVEWLAERAPDAVTGQLARAGWFTG